VLVTRHAQILARVVAGLAVVMATVAGPVSTAVSDESPGRTLYVTNGGTATVKIFTIGREGALSPLGSLVETGDAPRGIALSADGRRAYVATTVTDSTPNGVVWAYSVRDDGGLELLDTYETHGDMPFGIARTPVGQALYVANTASHTISGFTIESDGASTCWASRCPPVRSTREECP
jgi:DNA-binding beta-propeller fold protein YncE